MFWNSTISRRASVSSTLSVGFLATALEIRNLDQKGDCPDITSVVSDSYWLSDINNYVIKYKDKRNINIAVIKCKRPKPRDSSEADLTSRSAWLRQTEHKSRIGKFICRPGPDGFTWESKIDLTIACPNAGEDGAWETFYTPDCPENHSWDRWVEGWWASE